MIPRENTRCAHTIFPDDCRTELRQIMVLGWALHFHAPYRVTSPSHRGIDPAPVPDRAPQRLQEDR
jgi:hypothetical protein